MSAVQVCTYATLITVGATDFPSGKCRGLNVGSAGTIDVTWPDGSISVSYPVVSGYNPISIRRISAATASNIWALY